MTTPHTDLCSYDASSVRYRGRDLVCDLIGKASFVDVFFTQTFDRVISDVERRIVDAVLISLMEHGMTPSAIATRMVYSSSPENIQAGVAAGLLAVGSQFVGTMEDCALLLATIADAEDSQGKAGEIATGHRAAHRPVPGFGHHLHRPDDPRAIALLALADEVGTSGRFAAALRALATAVDSTAGRHVTINATGAIAALLGDIGVPIRLMRGFAVLARAAGLIAHIAEEQNDPSGRYIWNLLDESMMSPA
jgi:citrate synthase